MKRILQLEEGLLFAACLYFYPMFGLSWWWFAGFILVPDIGMLGYLINPKIGAFTYNLLHHKGVAIIVFIAGWVAGHTYLQFAGYILVAHSCMDRMMGYGLKLEEGFKFTHLGIIGKENN